MNLKDNKKQLLLTALAVLLLVLIAGAGYYFSQNRAKEGSQANNNLAPKAVCAELVVDNNQSTGKAPFSPVLRSKLTGDFSKTPDVCIWSVNGVESHRSSTVDGKCAFGNKKLLTPGDYTIALKVEGKTCSVSQKVVVE